MKSGVPKKHIKYKDMKKLLLVFLVLFSLLLFSCNDKENEHETENPIKSFDISGVYNFLYYGGNTTFDGGLYVVMRKDDNSFYASRCYNYQTLYSPLTIINVDLSGKIVGNLILRDTAYNQWKECNIEGRVLGYNNKDCSYIEINGTWTGNYTYYRPSLSQVIPGAYVTLTNGTFTLFKADIADQPTLPPFPYPTE